MIIFRNHVKILKYFNEYSNNFRQIIKFQDSVFTRNISNNLEHQKDIEFEESNIEIKPINHTKKKKLNEINYDETSYYVENGLRKVYPYYFLHQVYTKYRWLGRSISDVLREEFYAESLDYYIKYLGNNAITINGSTIQDLNYTLKRKDLLGAYVHRHETPVGHFPFNFVHLSDDLVVLNKPSSIPMSPVGRFRHNTILFILAKEFNLKNLYVINRLDALTSGIVLLARNEETASKFHLQLSSREIIKEYICQVEGKFPSVVTCEEPIECISRAIYQVGASGRKSKTEFFCLGFNGKNSLVLCKPHTGRTHQIRVHLQYLGYPIINDPIYNNEAFGPHKGKEGLIGKDRITLLKDLMLNRYFYKESNLGDIINIKDKNIGNKTSNPKWSWQQENLSSLKNDIKLIPEKHSIINFFGQINLKRDQLDYEFLSKLPSFDITKPKIVDPDCPKCRIKFKDRQEDLIMFLHALSYKGQNWEFRTKLPEWIF